MITLVQYKPQFGLPNVSPFCMKVETYLRMAGLDYKTEVMHDPRKTPKGKLPIIRDDGEIVADSTFILQHVNRKYGIDLNSHLGAQEKAEALAWQCFLEEHFYWILLYSRWVDDRYWPQINQAFFGHLPPVVKTLVPKLIRETVKKQLIAQGMGRHSEAEIYALGQSDLNALATWLGDKPFMMGEKISELDAVAFTFVANCLIPPIASPLQQYVRSHANLVAYCTRMKSAYFP
jgi:glutathione S-transferase